jgi:hypothetical protein
MVLLLSNLDAFVPSMELLVHSHSFFHFIVLKENCFSSVELFVKNGKLCLDSEIVNAFTCYQFVYFPKVICLGNVSKGCIASFSNVEVLLFNCKLGKNLPVGFCLWS